RASLMNGSGRSLEQQADQAVRAGCHNAALHAHPGVGSGTVLAVHDVRLLFPQCAYRRCWPVAAATTLVDVAQRLELLREIIAGGVHFCDQAIKLAELRTITRHGAVDLLLGAVVEVIQAVDALIEAIGRTRDQS